MVLADNIQDQTEFLGSESLIDAHFDFVIEDITTEQAAQFYDALNNDAVLKNITHPIGGWHPVCDDPIAKAIKEKMRSIQVTNTPGSLQAQTWDAGYIHGLKFALCLLGAEEVPDVE